jgi:putative transposase
VEVSSFTRIEELTPMTDDRLPLAELLAKTGDGDFLRLVAENVLQILMEANVDGLIGAGRHERSGQRTLDTRLGTLNLKIPKLRTGAYFPGFLEPRKTVEKALVAVIQEAWIAGVSIRRVDKLVQAMGMTGISQVVRIEAVQGHRRARECVSQAPARRRTCCGACHATPCHPF